MLFTPLSTFLSLCSSVAHSALHSFPTRRSSDLSASSIPLRYLFPPMGCSLLSCVCGQAETKFVVELEDNEAAFSLRSEEHTSELQSPCNLVCRLLLEKKKKI